MTDTTVTVYGKPRCMQCDATTRHLDKKGIAYTYRELEDHPEILEEALLRGLTSAPIVLVEQGLRTHMWSGFRHAQIEALPHILKENS